MTSPRLYMLQDPVIVIGLILVASITAMCLRFAWLRVSGQRRSWVQGLVFPTQFSDRVTWPFMVFCFSLAMVAALASVPFEIAGRDDLRELVWDWFFWPPWIGVILSLFFWPLFLTPPWYRRWTARMRQGRFELWRQEEVHRAVRLPAGKRRDGKLKDMAASGVDVERAWHEAGLPGSPPESWVDRQLRKAEEEKSKGQASD